MIVIRFRGETWLIKRKSEIECFPCLSVNDAMYSIQEVKTGLQFGALMSINNHLQTVVLQPNVVTHYIYTHVCSFSFVTCLYGSVSSNQNHI